MHAPVVTTGRDLRLDLFRGLALWLIFLDHIPSNLVAWITIRNYGFSDATEIFVFVSGYTAAFVYGKEMSERGFVVAGARILRRTWQIYVAHVFLFAIYLAEISYVATSFENPLYAEEMNILDFLKQPDVTIIQALLLKFKPSNMDVLPLYIILLLLFPPILWLLLFRSTLALAASVLLYVLTWEFHWNMPSYPSGHWYFNPFAWQLLFVFGAWCALGGAQRLSAVLQSRVTLGGRGCLSRVRIRHHADLVPARDEPIRPALARRGDLPDRQGQSRRPALCAFPGAGGGDGVVRPARVAAAQIVVGVAADRVRPALAGNLLPRRLSVLCRPFRHGRGIGRVLDAGPGQRIRHSDNDCRGRS